jgi:hypothetical protein
MCVYRVSWRLREIRWSSRLHFVSEKTQSVAGKTVALSRRAKNPNKMLPDNLTAAFLFSVVMAFTPGPNNVMLAASGANFGSCK